MQAASRPFGTAYELFGAIRFFIKYTFILYLFGATNFYNFSIILIKYKIVGSPKKLERLTI